MKESADTIINHLKSLGNPEIAERSAYFFKTGKGDYGENDFFLGIRNGPLRSIAKKCRNLGLNEVSNMLESEYHEVRLTALYILTYKVNYKGGESLEDIANCYLSKLDGVNNWDLVDCSSYKILGPYLEDRKRDLLYIMAESDDLWKKRIAMISCLPFIKQHDFDDALKICRILLGDEHDLIHKAVGWMLREIGNRDRDTEISFLNSHYSAMPRTMLRYAIEKFDEPERQKYLKGLI